MKKYFWLLLITIILVTGCTPPEDPIPTVNEIIVNKWKVNSVTTTSYYHTYNTSDSCFSEYFDTTTTTVNNDGLYEFKSDQTGYRLSSTAVQYDFTWINNSGVIVINYTGSSPDEQVTPTVLSATSMSWHFAPIVDTYYDNDYMCPLNWQYYNIVHETTNVKVASVEKM